MKKSYLLLMIAAIILTMVLSLASFLSFQKLFQEMNKRYDLLIQDENLIHLLSDVKDAETGQRGYIITGYERYLEPYQKALKTIDKRLSLVEKGLDSADDHVHFLELSRLIDLKLDELNRTIQIRRTEGFAAAQKRVVNREGKQFMDSIRAIIGEMSTHQRQLIAQQSEIVKTTSQRSFWFNVWGGLLNTLLVGLYSFLFYRDTLHIQRVKQQFQHTYDLYQAILDHAKQIIMTTDTEGKVTTFNKEAEAALGYSSDEVIGKMTMLDFYEQGKISGKAEELVRQTKNLQRTQFDTLVTPSRYLAWAEAEWIMKKKNGALLPCVQTITALRDGNHQIEGYLFMGLEWTNHQKGREEILPSSQPRDGRETKLNQTFTVLVIDQDEDFRSLVSAYLQELGCQVWGVSTGEEGLYLAKAHAINLIVMDMLLSPMNGYDIVRELQSDEDLKKIPYVFISSIAQEVRGKIPGARAFLNKPVQKQELGELIQRMKKDL